MQELTWTRKCPGAQQVISEKQDSLSVRVRAHLQVHFSRLTAVFTQRWETELEERSKGSISSLL